MSTCAISLWHAWTRSRDAVALEQLVLPEIPHAVAWARRLGCTQADAEDATQEALALLAARRDDQPVEVGLRAWMCRTVRDRASSLRRSERRRHAREAAVAVPEWHQRASERSPLLVREEVERVLTSLSADERQAVALRFLHDMDYQSIAFVLGTSEGAARQRVHVAVGRMRERFGPNAYAALAALPLPTVPRPSVLLERAIVASTSGTNSIGGILAMATATQKLLGASLAAAAVIAGALTASRVLHPSERTPEVASTAQEHSAVSELPTLASHPPLEGMTAVPTPPPDPVVGVPGPEIPSDYLTRGEAWRKAIMQGADLSARSSAWAEVRAALHSADTTTLLAALHAVAFTAHVGAVEREGLQEVLDRLCDAPDWQICALAWTAKANTWVAARNRGGESAAAPLDAERLREKIQQCPDAVRARLLGILMSTQGLELDEASEDMIVALLRDPAKAGEAVRGVGRATRVSDRVMSQVLAVARQSPEATQSVQRFVLSGMENKNREAVIFLLQGVEAGTPHALEILGRGGVRAEDAAYAGEWLRRLFSFSRDPATRQQIVNTIGHIRDSSSRDWLQEIGENDRDLASSVTLALRNLNGGKPRHRSGQPR